MAMAQGPELSEMQQRVEAAAARFREITEDGGRRGERLAGLLDRVETGVARGHREIARLNRALAAANDENARLRDLLQTVVALAEQLEEPAETMGLSELEARMERLGAEAGALDGAGDLPDDEGSWESDDEAGAVAGSRDALQQSYRMAEGARFQSGGGRGGHFVMAEFGPVQDIFKRVSMMTGRLRET